MVVESFHSMTRVGDKFLQLLKDKGEDMSRMFVFTDFVEKIVDRVPQDDLPIGEVYSHIVYSLCHIVYVT